MLLFKANAQNNIYIYIKKWKTCEITWQWHVFMVNVENENENVFRSGIVYQHWPGTTE